MSYRKTCSEYLLILLASLSIIGMLQIIHPVAAAGTLSIDPQTTTLADVGATVTVNVRVDNLDQFIGWDIALTTNATALNGTSIDYGTQNIFQTTGPGAGSIYPLTCINGGAGGSCDGGPSSGGIDGPGVVETSGTFIPGSNPPPTGPISGVLFSVSFVAGKGTFTSLKFIKTEIDGNCNPNCQPLTDFSYQNGVYGTEIVPDINFLTLDQSLSVIQGSRVNTTLTVSSVKFFSGQVNFAYRLSPPSSGIAVTFNVTSVNIDNVTAPTEHANLTIAAGPTALATHYILNITATGPRVFQYVLVDLNVQSPGSFIISESPSILYMAQDSSSRATLIVSSQPRQQASQEFSGNVTLKVAVMNATVSLSQTKVYLSPGANAVTTLSVSVPKSFYAFTYLINITGFWDKNPNLNYTGQLTITHLPFDLIPTASPTTLTVIAGHSAYGVLSVASANYFVGPVYASSILSGGTARYNVSSTFLNVGQTVSFSLNITIGAATVPGTYTVLLTAYSRTGIARSVIESIHVISTGHSSPIPTKILGLPITVYFGVLAAFALVFVILSVVVYRKSRLDRDEWE